MVEKRAKEIVTREYTINLHKALHGVTFKKRAPKAIKAVRVHAPRTRAPSPRVASVARSAVAACRQRVVAERWRGRRPRGMASPNPDACCVPGRLCRAAGEGVREEGDEDV